jgi:large repetitive protein
MKTHAILIVGACYGLLQAATVSGVVTDSASGEKLDNAVVQLRSGTKVVAADTTGGDGAYSFAGVDTGKYTVRASKAEYVTKSESARVRAGDTQVTVSVPMNAIVTATASGTVADSATGGPLAGAVVQVLSGSQVLKAGKCGADGKYSFEKVEVDTYTIQASLSGYTSQSLVLIVRNSSPVTVNFRLAAVVTAKVGGKIIDSASSAGIAGVAVQLRSGSGIVAIDTSESDGLFAFEKVEIGEYALKASVAGYRVTMVPVSVASVAAVIVGVSLVPSVYGAVVCAVTADSIAGKALDAVTVVLRRGVVPVDTSASDARGVCYFDKVETGVDYELVGTKPGYGLKNVALFNKKTGADTVRFFLAPLMARGIRVYIVKASDSTGISGAAVTLAMSGGSAVIAGGADSSGRALFDKIGEGAYTVSASASGFAATSRQYTVNAGSGDSIRIYLAKAPGGTKTLIGAVLDSISAAPLGNATVSIRWAVGAGAPVTLAAITAANGSYAITGISRTAKVITLTAELKGYATRARTIPLGTDTTADTVKVDVNILSEAAGNHDRAAAPTAGGRPYVRISSDGRLTLFNGGGCGAIRLFGLNGREIFRCPVQTGADAHQGVSGHFRLPAAVLAARLSRLDGSEAMVMVLREMR